MIDVRFFAGVPSLGLLRAWIFGARWKGGQHSGRLDGDRSHGLLLVRDRPQHSRAHLSLCQVSVELHIRTTAETQDQSVLFFASNVQM